MSIWELGFFFLTSLVVMSNAEHSLDHCNFHSSTHYLIRLPAQSRLKGTQASLGEDSTEEGR